jgi:hypothetical protein
MKRAIVFAAAMLMMGPVLWAAPFTQGNLVILRVGPGTEALTNAGNTLFLDEYTTNGGFVQSLMLTTNQFVTAGGVTNYPIDLTGGNTSEGNINLSTDGRYVVVGGFATNRLWLSNGGNISSTAGASIPRVIAVVDSKGNIDTSTAPTDLVTGSGGDIRGVASTDGSNFWIASSSAGIAYTTLGSNVTTKVQGATNKRCIGIFNSIPETVYPPSQQQVFNMSAGGLFASGTNYPMVQGAEMPLTNIINNAVLVSPYGFLALHLRDGISSNIDTVYVCDDASLTGGISKWTFNSATTNFLQTGGINAALSPFINTNGTGGVRQLTGKVNVSGNQTNVDLYITASANTFAQYGYLFHITDTSGFGGTLTGTLPAPIVSAPATTTWRGIAFAPSDRFRVSSITRSGSNVSVTWNAMGGRNYIVQASPGNGSGGYDGAVFSDISGTNFALGFGPTQASYVDVGGGSGNNKYYRVKLVPEP